MLYDFPREVGFGDFSFKVESKAPGTSRERLELPSGNTPDTVPSSPSELDYWVHLPRSKIKGGSNYVAENPH
jgi:hypothetical protein